MFGFLELEDDPEVLAAAAGRRRAVAARARARPHDRPDGLHDERRERRDDRGLRARADDQAAVAPAATTSACCEERRAWRRRSTCSCGSCRSPTARRSCRSSSSSPSEVEPRHGITLRKMIAPLAAQGHGPLRRGLQRGLERELGLRRPYSKKDLDAYAQELQLVFDQQLVHGRRDRRRRDRRRSRSPCPTSTRCWRR